MPGDRQNRTLSKKGLAFRGHRSACATEAHPLVFGRGATADVFVEDARDQALIRKPFFRSAPFAHLKVRRREADVNPRTLPKVAPGRLDSSLLREL